MLVLIVAAMIVVGYAGISVLVGMVQHDVDLVRIILAMSPFVMLLLIAVLVLQAGRWSISVLFFLVAAMFALVAGRTIGRRRT